MTEPDKSRTPKVPIIEIKKPEVKIPAALIGRTKSVSISDLVEQAERKGK
jgi:hypothetical protein